MYDHKLNISICICTFKRPDLLKKLLFHLLGQKDDELYYFNIIVVDNDFNMSAKQTVEAFISTSKLRTRYFCEPRKNIALARNKAIQNADGELVVFIDDDEIPSAAWLTTMVRCFLDRHCDGVLGPVIPKFVATPPNWILRSNIFDRPDPQTGSIISPKDMRTGNVLLKRNIFKGDQNPFKPELGITGGEDVEFFERMTKGGHKFIWCHEAAAFELIAKERLAIDYHLRRAINRGKARALIDPLISLPTIKSLFAFIIYFFFLPFTIFGGLSLFNKYLIRLCDHSGRIIGHLRNAWQKLRIR